MTHWVRIEYPDGRNQRVEIEPGKVSLGRHESNDVPVTCPLVSGRHLVLEAVGDALFVQDLASTHGTRINGEPLEPGRPFRLQTGDVVQVAVLKLSVEGHSHGDDDEDLLETRPALALEEWEEGVPPTPSESTPDGWQRQTLHRPRRALDRMQSEAAANRDGVRVHVSNKRRVRTP